MDGREYGGGKWKSNGTEWNKIRGVYIKIVHGPIYTRCSTINPTTTIELRPVQMSGVPIKRHRFTLSMRSATKSVLMDVPRTLLEQRSLHRCTHRVHNIRHLYFAALPSSSIALYRKLWAPPPPTLARVGHVEAIKKGLHQMRSLRYQSIPDILLFLRP